MPEVIIQFVIVLAAIIAGARLGGIGLGVMGGLGLALLCVCFGLKPTSPPVDVMLMIVAVIAAASCMQAAGGLDYMVRVAERVLRGHPRYVTLLAPLVTYLFTFVAGTGHIAYSVLPVIAEVARDTGIRPERPLGIAVIASQQAITASPISAATVALLGLLSGFDISLFDILKVSLPATFAGVVVGACCSLHVGKELEDDPEYQRRLREGLLAEDTPASRGEEGQEVLKSWKARLSVALFLLGTLLVILFGSSVVPRPAFTAADGTPEVLDMPSLIEAIMLSVAALILLLCRMDGVKAVKGSVFSAGMQAVVAIFGIAWMGDTFIAGNLPALSAGIEGVVRAMPWLFGLALFVMSVLLYSQAATVRAVMPLGLALGMSPALLIALFPAVNGYFFLPNYPTVVAAMGFDRTGTTRIGKYVLNHSFMMPGMVATGVSVAVGLLLAEWLW